jgi:hypothetical protein
MTKAKDEPIQDPQTYITRFNFTRDNEVDERSRVDSYDELALVERKKVLFRVTGVNIYGILAESRLHLKISKDGKGREEAVDSLKATNDPMKGLNTGFGVVVDAIDQQKG